MTIKSCDFTHLRLDYKKNCNCKSVKMSWWEERTHFYTSAKVFLKIYDEKYAAYLYIVSNFLSQFTISHIVLHLRFLFFKIFQTTNVSFCWQMWLKYTNIQLILLFMHLQVIIGNSNNLQISSCILHNYQLLIMLYIKIILHSNNLRIHCLLKYRALLSHYRYSFSSPWNSLCLRGN